MTCSAIGMCYVPKEARLMDPFAKLTPLFWWQTTPCNTKEHCSQILETVRILPFAKQDREVWLAVYTQHCPDIKAM